MVIFLYSDKNCEYQAISCIKSLTHKITDDVVVLYYTIGFDSNFEFRNLRKIRIEPKAYFPTFHFYKSELSLLTMQLYPDDYYIFTDTDVLFSRNFEFNQHKYNEFYPMASFGPHEYPFIWEMAGEGKLIFDETKLMKYFNVPQRSMRYCWSCFFAFNPSCKDFFEEYESICHNSYLMKQRKNYFPYADETAFNICLWKRQATKNLGFSFVNTHLLETVKLVEEKRAKNSHITGHVDDFGQNWQYVEDPDRVILYHGFKNPEDIDPTLKYLLNL